ncbi:hypothetical protein SPFM10_00132 [Salmonella phage SPFM10]|nr:hypothetical protein SPFM10_00132 [Salmonella phage SPFM10]
MTFEWLKFFKDGYFGHVSQQELFTFAELNNLSYYPDSGPGNKYLLAGDSTNAYNSVCYRGYIPVDYLNEAVVQSVDAPIKSLATPTRINLTVRDLLPALRDLYGVWLSDSSALSDLFKIAPRVYVPQTAKTVVGKPGKGFSGECTVYYDRLIGVRGIPAETTKNGRNTVITFCQQVVRDNPELAGRISADSTRSALTGDFMGLYSAPELELRVAVVE